MGYTINSFLKTIRPYVIADMRKTGILASLTTAQGMIESNKGNSGLTQKANNLFGIKGSYMGQSITLPTKEFINGKYITVNAAFRKYPSWQESISDHSAMFNRMPRYTNLRNCQDYVEACKNVKQDGYATAPDYTNTLTNTIKHYKLWMWDYEVLKDYPFNRLRTVKAGSYGAGVYLLQLILRDKGFTLNSDAVFGKQTESAVKAYQHANQLEEDGIVGQNTWKKLKG